MSEPRRRIVPDRLSRARELRRAMTGPERTLWHLLRNGRLGGLKFRRQVPIGPFVADFVCVQRKLVVELDGMSHVGQADADDKRSDYLRREGYTVLRVTNDDVLQHEVAVATAIGRAAGLAW